MREQWGCNEGVVGVQWGGTGVAVINHCMRGVIGTSRSKAGRSAMNLRATSSPGSPAALAPDMSRANATAHVRLTCAKALPAAPRSYRAWNSSATRQGHTYMPSIQLKSTDDKRFPCVLAASRLPRKLPTTLSGLPVQMSFRDKTAGS